MKIKLLSILSAILLIFCSTTTIYADDSNDWLYIQQIASDKQSAVFLSAFKAYMNANSSYLTFSYNQQKAIVNFTYNKLNEIQKSLGLSSIPTYYNDIAVATANNGHLKFYYTASGLKFMDDLFKGVMDYYGIDVTDMTKEIYQGEWWEDIHGNGCYIYHIGNITPNNLYGYSDFSRYITRLGSPYIYNFESLNNLYDNAIDNGTKQFTLTFNPTNSLNFDITFKCDTNASVKLVFNNTNVVLRHNYSNIDASVILYKANNNNYEFGTLSIFENNNSKYFSYAKFNQYFTDNSDIKQQLINLAKEGANAVLPAVGKSAAIDVGQYGNDALQDALDHLTDTTKKKPDIDPVDDPVNPPSVNPPGINIPVGIVNNMPINIQLPDLDDLIPDPIQQIPQGFTIPGLRYKFPFCIPFDMVAIYVVLDQTPQAPYFETEINFASFNYDLVIDLEEYDPYMVHIRNYFIILYIFGLLFITPKLLKA